MQTLKIPCDGYELAADWYEGEKPEVLLVIPGWSSNKQNYEDLVGAITGQTRMAALVVDLRGHGQSPFRLPDLTPEQNFHDVLAVYDWLKANHSDKTINVMGTSYGAYLAAVLATSRPINKLILRAPAIYRPEYFRTKWGSIDREENRIVYRHDAQALASNPVLVNAANFKGRALVIVHELDDTVPTVTSDAYIKAFHAEQYMARGVDHYMTQYEHDRSKVKEHRQAIADWLNKA